MPTGQLQFFPPAPGSALVGGIGADFYAIVLIPSTSASAPVNPTYIAIFLTTFAQVGSGFSNIPAAVTACQVHYNALAS